uniref:Nematode cuticle collagen N-terminal domain-containing protein n=1 Tax=Panagrellus redivivus TaxID=6233 RepID=A0A7E4W6B7_PANRE
MAALSGIQCMIALFSIIAFSEAFYMPASYERYMDEKQAVFQALLAEIARRHDSPPPVAESKPVTTAPALLQSAEKSNEEYPTAPLVPRRDQRNFYFAPQYKRMRPCFYSPIQCLMKRSSQ